MTIKDAYFQKRPQSQASARAHTATHSEIADRQTGSDRRNDAGKVQGLGCQVGPVSQNCGERNLDGGVVDPLGELAGDVSQCHPNGHTAADFDQEDLQARTYAEASGDDAGGEHREQCCCGSVIEQTFALHNEREARRYRHLLEDRKHGDGICSCGDCAKD